MGIKVPDGFVVTTDAFYMFMKSNDLEKQKSQKLQLITDENDEDQVEIISEKIRHLIEVLKYRTTCVMP